MPKTALLFAGQGAQTVGMARDLYDSSPAAKIMLDKAEAIFPSILDMMFSGPQEMLNATVNTQPCVFAADMAAFYAWREAGGDFDAAAGFSLGEYAALCASGALDFDDAFRLVVNRAQWMAEASSGGMAAVLGLDGETVKEMVDTIDDVWAVNFNCPGQTVIAGNSEALSQAELALKEKGARIVRLPVSGPFHTPLMKEAADKIHIHLSQLSIHHYYKPVYANRTAQPYGNVARELPEQTAAPVLWEATIRAMLADGIEVFIEMGPGETLSGFMKRIDRKVLIYRVSDNETLKKAIKEA